MEFYLLATAQLGAKPSTDELNPAKVEVGGVGWRDSEALLLAEVLVEG